MACPLCKSKQFYVKDPDDSFETHDFELEDGQPRFEDPDSAPIKDEIEKAQEIFCQRCAWHGPFDKI